MPSRRGIGFRAGIAEFLLILRLKSHRRADRTSDIPEHAARIISVTCKNWFTGLKGPADAKKVPGAPPQRCVPL